MPQHPTSVSCVLLLIVSLCVIFFGLQLELMHVCVRNRDRYIRMLKHLHSLDQAALAASTTMGGASAMLGGTGPSSASIAAMKARVEAEMQV